MSSRTSHGAVPHDDLYLTTSTMFPSSAPAWATLFLILVETQPPGDSEACGFIFLIGRKRRRVEPHAYVVVEGVSELLIWYPPWKTSATSLVGGGP